jgi:cell wall assembly regulator SMI1
MAEHGAGDIAAQWRRIEQWLAAHAPGWLDARGARPLLNPPASQEALARLEAQLRLALPAQLKASLLAHDGCRQGEHSLAMRATRPTKWRMLSAAEIAEEHARLSAIPTGQPVPRAIRSEGSVQPVWWSAGWIPLAECGTGDVVCADMTPPRGGSHGQLILYEHDFAERKRLYRSLLEWLRECADDLERGEYAYVEGIGLRGKNEPEAG